MDIKINTDIFGERGGFWRDRVEFGRHCGGRGGRGSEREGRERGDQRHEGGGHDFRGRGQGGFERGFGGGRARLFDAGDLKLVILKLLSEQPSYGYQLIKSMEQRLSGGYTPSAGAVYPTLTMLEEEGLTAAALESNKKVYSVTHEGMEYLQSNSARIKELFERLEETGRGFERGRTPEIMKAFMDLRGAVAARASRGNMTPEQMHKIAEAIHAAAKTIDGL